MWPDEFSTCFLLLMVTLSTFQKEPFAMVAIIWTLQVHFCHCPAVTYMTSVACVLCASESLQGLKLGRMMHERLPTLSAYRWYNFSRDCPHQCTAVFALKQCTVSRLLIHTTVLFSYARLVVRGVGWEGGRGLTAYCYLSLSPSCLVLMDKVCLSYSIKKTAWKTCCPGSRKDEN